MSNSTRHDEARDRDSQNGVYQIDGRQVYAGVCTCGHWTNSTISRGQAHTRLAQHIVSAQKA